MAINQNHLFEELNGVKCAIVEKNVNPERADFLRRLLEFNRFTVVVVPSPPPKAAATPAGPAQAPAAAAASTASTPSKNSPPDGPAQENAAQPEAPPAQPPAPAAPQSFTVGVTDVSFNPINAIFGRLLRTPGGHIVTLAYWQQKDPESRDEIPYFTVK